MLLMAFGEQPPPALGGALAAAGFAVERPALPSAGGDGSPARLAAVLREVEARLEAERPYAVLVTGAGEEALMAAVTAVKAGIPTVAVAAADGPAIASHVADLELSATQNAEAAAQAIRDLVTPTLPLP